MPFIFVEDEKEQTLRIEKPKEDSRQDITFCNADNPQCPKASIDDIHQAEELKEMIYLDNNATHPVLPEVRTAIMDAMAVEGNASSKHLAGRRMRGMLDGAREKVAMALGLKDPSGIIFTSGGTESNNLVPKGVVWVFRVEPLAVSSIEHKSVLSTAMYFRYKALGVTLIRVDSGCVVDLDQIGEMASRTKFFSIMSSNNETGAIQPIDEIVRIIREKTPHAYIHSDISQSIGKASLPDLSQLDAVTFSCHKFGGPIGIGGIYLKDKNSIVPMFHGGNQEFGLRPGTYNVPLAVGMAAAFASIRKDDIFLMLQKKQVVDNGLIALGGIPTIGESLCLSNTTSMVFKGIDADSLIGRLSSRGVFISAGSACTAYGNEPSHVLKAMGMSDNDCRSTIRVSISKFTTDAQIARFIEIITEELKDCKRMGG